MDKIFIPRIETARLILRGFGETDLDDWAQKVFADPEVMRYIPRRDLSPSERARRAFSVFTQHWQDRNYGVWALIDRKDGHFIGHCGLNYLDDTGEVEVLYALAKADWGMGLATEAAHASLTYGFETMLLDRIIGLAMPENLASRRVLEKAGLAYLNQSHYFNLVVAYFAVTRDQFLKSNQPL